MDPYLERERKYDADDDVQIPDVGTATVRTRELTATYVDTEDGLLQLRGCTLRRRTGGEDDGWHLKVPDPGGRLELRTDPGPEEPPAELVALTTGLRLARPLVPRAVLVTTRTTYGVHAPDGRLVVEVSDDRVAAKVAASGEERRWREIEVELGPAGTEQDLDHWGDLVLAAGATAAQHASKLARAVGDPRPPELPEDSDLARTVDDYLQTQYEQLAWGDLRLRRGENAVHKTRVAVRRIRSTLRIFASLLDPERAGRLDRELAWYAAALGEVRDLDVAGRIVSEDLQDERLVPDGAAPGVLHAVHARREESWRALLDVLEGHRYAALLRQVAEWREEPPFQAQSAVEAGADASAGGDAELLLRRARKKSDKRLRQARRSRGDAAGAAYHRARKAAKRTRYAAELTEPLLGKRARRLARKHERRQDELGELQDHVAVIGLLRDLGSRETSSPTAFACGVLAQRHEHRRRRLLRRGVVR